MDWTEASMQADEEARQDARHTDAYALPRGGTHYLATGALRKRLYDASGLYSAPICNTGDGHAKTTDQLKHVTCEACRALAILHVFHGEEPK